MVLMFIGCAPASMGGGITTGTFSVIGLMLSSYARNRNRVQAFGRYISPNTVRRAGAVLAISVGLVMLITFLILLTHPGMRVDMALFEVVSAFATCGLSLGVTGELNQFGRVLIALMMFWGRLGALTIVIAVSQVNPTPQLVSYPEESILIG
jgi:trk system potassium uptake protein TrkH